MVLFFRGWFANFFTTNLKLYLISRGEVIIKFLDPRTKTTIMLYMYDTHVSDMV